MKYNQEGVGTFIFAMATTTKGQQGYSQSS